MAARLADLALGGRPAAYSRATDLAGPDVLDLGEIATLVRQHRGARPPRVVRVPPFNSTTRALSERRNVPAPGTAETGGRSFRDWLDHQPRVLTGR